MESIYDVLHNHVEIEENTLSREVRLSIRNFNNAPYDIGTSRELLLALQAANLISRYPEYAARALWNQPNLANPQLYVPGDRYAIEGKQFVYPMGEQHIRVKVSRGIAKSEDDAAIFIGVVCQMKHNVIKFSVIKPFSEGQAHIIYRTNDKVSGDLITNFKELQEKFNDWWKLMFKNRVPDQVGGLLKGWFGKMI